MLLACSGGMDSTMMLHLFHRVAFEAGIEVTVGHINHQLRKAADQDEQFVRTKCESLGVECMVERVDVRAACAKTGESQEMAARRLRYSALEQMRRQAGARYICTAHTKSDQAETVLMRVLEGTGVTGLQGIRRRRGNIIRPLLGFTRNEIRDYAETHQFAYRDDSTNQDLSIRRNWIRHRLIPQITREVNPSLEETLTRVAAVQSEMEDMLSSVAEDAMGTVLIDQTEQKIILDILRLQNYFTPVQKTIIFKCLSELGLRQHSLNFPQMQQLITILTGASSGTSMMLPGGITVLKDRTCVLLTTGGIEQQFQESFQTEGTTRVGGYLITAQRKEVLSESSYDSSQEMEAFFDGETLEEMKPVWRSWRHGDVIRLPHGGTKKLSDVWIDHKVPIWEKYSRPLLAAGQEVLWVPGLKRSGIGWLTTQSQTMIHLIAVETS